MSESAGHSKSAASGFWISVVMVVVGFAGWWVNWQSTLEEGRYRPIGAFVTPFIVFLGLAFLVAPPPEDQFIAKYGEAALGRRTLRLRISQLLGLMGIVAGGINFALMKGWF